MTVIRQIANALLRIAAQRMPADSQSWDKAMLGELKFIESDWAALRWALGSTTALLRYSARRQLRKRFEKGIVQPQRGTLMNLGKKAIGLLSGVVIACAVLAFCVFGLFYLAPLLFPAQKLDHAPMVELFSVIVLRETVFIVAAIMLWRRKRPLAAGLLLVAMTFIIHVVVHAATKR